MTKKNNKLSILDRIALVLVLWLVVLVVLTFVYFLICLAMTRPIAVGVALGLFMLSFILVSIGNFEND